MTAVYPLTSALAAAIVVALELLWLRTGVFRQPAYWLALAVTLGFMVPVDGWMSKTSDPIVVYDPAVLSGVRFPIDIPVEEFVYAFAMVTLTIVLWERAGGEVGGRGTAEPSAMVRFPRSRVPRKRRPRGETRA